MTNADEKQDTVTIYPAKKWSGAWKVSLKIP